MGKRVIRGKGNQEKWKFGRKKGKGELDSWKIRTLENQDFGISGFGKLGKGEIGDKGKKYFGKMGNLGKRKFKLWKNGKLGKSKIYKIDEKGKEKLGGRKMQISKIITRMITVE